MKFGARILKTGLAVVLAYYVCMWLSLEPPLIAVVAAVLTTQPSIYMSLRFFVDQLQANVIGALASIGAYTVMGGDPIVTGLTVMVVIALNMLLRLESSVSLAILTVIAVMDNPDGALNRFVLVMLGVVLAILVNAAFLPPNHERQFKEKLRSIHDRLFPLLRNAPDHSLTTVSLSREREELAEELKRADDLFHTYKEERTLFKRQRMQKQQRLVIYRNMLETVRLELRLLRQLLGELPEDWREPVKESVQEMTQAHELILLKLEGKVKTRLPVDRNIARNMEGLLARLFDDASGRGEAGSGAGSGTTGIGADTRPPLALVRLMGDLVELEERLERLNRQVSHYLGHLNGEPHGEPHGGSQGFLT